MDTKTAIKQLKRMRSLAGQMRLAADEWDAHWKTLIAIIMSAQTRDEVTIPLATDLFARYSSVSKLARAKESDILKIIRSVNFSKTKAKNIRTTAQIINSQYRGIVPLDIDTLVMLPGVGRKTANVFLSEVGKEGLGVDTHVSYISQKLGWTKHKNPDKIEVDLKKLFPRKYWNEVNPILVRFGKTYLSRKRKNYLLEGIKITR